MANGVRIHHWLSGLAVIVAAARMVAAAAPTPTALEVGSGERLVVIAPHPDDETLGAGGLVQRVLARGGSARIVLITAGDGYVEAVVHDSGLLRPPAAQYVAYGRRRIKEARAAIRELGGDQPRLQFLGFPDGGLSGLLRAHWYRTHAERSQTTDASDPPYDEDAIDPDLPYDGDDLRRELARLLAAETPTMIVFPDPLDRHPDHRAAGLFTLLAVADAAGITVSPTPAALPVPRPTLPRLLAYLVHWPDWPPGWNAAAPRFDTKARLRLPKSLPMRHRTAVELVLTDAEVASKRAALQRYQTQQLEMAVFLAGFVRRSEPFTVIPATQLEHLGRMVERHTPPAP